MVFIVVFQLWLENGMEMEKRFFSASIRFAFIIILLWNTIKSDVDMLHHCLADSHFSLP